LRKYFFPNKTVLTVVKVRMVDLLQIKPWARTFFNHRRSSLSSTRCAKPRLESARTCWRVPSSEKPVDICNGTASSIYSQLCSRIHSSSTCLFTRISFFSLAKYFFASPQRCFSKEHIDSSISQLHESNQWHHFT